MISKVESDVSILVFEGGFPSLTALHSFALSIGIRERRREIELISVSDIEIRNLSSYPLASMIAYELYGGPEDPDRMEKELLRYLQGGLNILEDEIRGKDRASAIRRVVELSRRP